MGTTGTTGTGGTTGATGTTTGVTTSTETRTRTSTGTGIRGNKGANANDEMRRDGRQAFICLRNYISAVQRHPHVSESESDLPSRKYEYHPITL